MPLVRPGDAVTDAGHVAVHSSAGGGIEVQRLDQLRQALLRRDEVAHPVIALPSGKRNTLLFEKDHRIPA